MKKINLLGKLILASSLAVGFATVSQADINNSIFVTCDTYNKSTGKSVICWSVPDSEYFMVTSFRIYRSQALSRKDYLENKEVEYKKIATVSYDACDKKVDGDDWNYRDYTRRLKDLKKDKYYRYKIEAYYGKKLVSTDYCGGSSTAQGFSYFRDQVNAKKYVFGWDKEDEYKDKTFRFYLSEAVNSYKDTEYNVRYKEYGEVSGQKGKFTIKGLKPGKDYYYYIVIIDGDKEIYNTSGRIGTMPGLPENSSSGFDKDSITVPFAIYSNSGCDGMIVYRKNKKGKFVKVADIKRDGEMFIDKNVEAGRSYTYKARSYKKIDGKTYYSIYTDEVTESAVNEEGKIKVSIDKKDKSVIKIESTDKYNGIISNWDTCFNDNPELYGIKQYSLDGVKWINTDGTDIPALRPQKAIYFRIDTELSPDSISEDLSISVSYGEGPFFVRSYELRYDCDDNKSSLSLHEGYE